MQSFLQQIWEFLLPVPMPWQAVLVVLLVLPLVPLLILRFLPWLAVKALHIFLFLTEFIVQFLCLFEYQLTQTIRNNKLKPPGILYVVSDFLAGIVRFLQLAIMKAESISMILFGIPWLLSPKWLYALPLVFVPIWFSRQHLGTSSLGATVDGSASLWCSLENWIMTGVRTPSNLTCRYPNSSPKWDTFFKSTEYEYKRKIQGYTNRIFIKPNDVYAYYLRGNAYLDIDEIKAAFTDYTKSIRIDPKFAPGYIGRGNIYLLKEDKGAALAQYSNAIRVSSNYSSAYVGRGNAYLAMNDKSSAFRDYSTAIKIDPKYVSAHVGRGNIYQRKGDKKAALNEYKKSIQIAPSYALAHAELGNLYYRNFDNREAAVREYKKAAEILVKEGNARHYREIMRRLSTLNKHKHPRGSEQKIF
jgi:Tfp pilus assembly protein PilF